jgi:hypothetical protein
VADAALQLRPRGALSSASSLRYGASPVSLQVSQRIGAGDRLYAADTCGHAGFGHVILNRPMSPVRCTCVPPHSSRLVPMSNTRTVVAVLFAEQHDRRRSSARNQSIGITRACVAALARISSFTTLFNQRGSARR